MTNDDLRGLMQECRDRLLSVYPFSPDTDVDPRLCMAVGYAAGALTEGLDAEREDRPLRIAQTLEAKRAQHADDEDVLTLIDDALYDEDAGEYSSLGIVLRRARDEIVALRQAGVVRYSHGAKVLYGVTASRIRAEALEEVARMIDEQPWRTDPQTGHLTINGELVTRSFMAAAIRALKERQA